MEENSKADMLDEIQQDVVMTKTRLAVADLVFAAVINAEPEPTNDDEREVIDAWLEGGDENVYP